VNAAGNLLPTVSMTSPTSGSSYNAPASVSITATASDADGSVSKVEFYNGSTLIGTSTSAPYSFTWSNVAAGTYSLTAKATDNANGTATTSSVSITVKTVVTNSCAGIPQFVENGGYVAGSKVQNAGNQYQCKPYPYSGWCNGAAWAYAPGTGSYWTDAWILVGSCSSSAKMASTSDATSVNSYPNPFSNTTNLEVTIQEAGNVTLKVFDKTGNLISTISEGNYLPGTYYFTFEGNGLKGDVYVIQLISNDKVSTYKLVKTE
jgi:flagellar hook assembly protein FlgD